MAKAIAETEQTLLLRTHFGDDAAWKKLCALVTKKVGEFQAYVTPLSDRQYDGISVKEIVKLAKRNHAFVLVADVIAGGRASTLALEGSTEAHQF